MRKRPLGRFGRMATSLVSTALLGLGLSAPAWAGDAATAPETETVQILDAAKSGDLSVTVRGAGDTRVKFTIQNKTSKRLNVVIPPGLVAASATGQGGFQSMGLGVPTANLGSFGAFRGNRGNAAGFRSMPMTAPTPEGLAISPGQTIEVPVPSVCLNFGMPTPTAKNVFDLKDVESYSPDARVRRALKSLATLGTSQTVAQAAMWHVCNGMSYDQIARQDVISFNSHELAQAARFVDALDTSSTDLVDPAYFQTGRLLVSLHGEGLSAKDAKRIAADLDGIRMMGLPIKLVTDLDGLEVRPGTTLLSATLLAGKAATTTTRVTVRVASASSEWTVLGHYEVRSASSMGDLAAAALVADIGRGAAKTFVTVTPVRRVPGTTTVKITNRLPMTIANLTLKTGKAGDTVQVDAIGIGPVRSASVGIPAASAVVDSVELNGL